MILDESIELKNKKQNISEMNKEKLSVSEMRNCMHEIMSDDNMSECLYEILVQEGFLPEDMNEGEDHGNMCEVMLEDDMVAEEMYKSCTNNQTVCGNHMRNWLKERYGVDEYDKPAMDSFQDQYGKEAGKSAYYATANKQHRNPESFKVTKEDIMSELSPETKYAASNVAALRHSDSQKNGDDFGAQKLMRQSDKFSTHVQPEISNMVEKIALAFGNETRGRVTKGIKMDGTESKPYAIINFNNYGNDIKIGVTKTGNKLIHGNIPNNLKPMIHKLIKDIQVKELPDESMNMAVGNLSEDDVYNTMNPEQDANMEQPVDVDDTPGSGDTSERYSFFNNLIQIHEQIGKLLEIPKEEIEGLLNNGDDWAEDHLATAKESIDQVFDFFMTQFNGVSNDDGDTSNMDDLGRVNPDSDDVSTPEDNQSISENELPSFKPIKGKTVDMENKSNAKKDDKNEVKNAKKSQKTIEQKTQEKINVKFSPDMESDFQKQISNKYLGAFNALNLDFQNEVPQSYKDRVELEVKTGHSRKRDEEKYGKEANVDHESTERTGNALINASKNNQGERDDFYKANPVTVTQDPYQQTSITGKNKGGKKNPGGGDINEIVDRDIERMKKIFIYEETQLDENKKIKSNEDTIIFNSVSKKEFI